MAELRLEDIIGFFVAGGILLLIGLVGVLTYVLWPQIAVLSRAFWARHFNGNWWADTLEWIADQREGVRGYEAAPEPRSARRPEWLHMSSHEAAPEHHTPTVPGTGTKSVPSPVPAKNDLTYDEAVRQVAAIKVGGKWFMSGKKLYSSVGGNHARFLEIVSEVRGDIAAEDVPAAPSSPPADAPRTLRVRDSGVDRFIPIDPEYQPPNGM